MPEDHELFGVELGDGPGSIVGLDRRDCLARAGEDFAMRAGIEVLPSKNGQEEFGEITLPGLAGSELGDEFAIGGIVAIDLVDQRRRVGRWRER